MITTVTRGYDGYIVFVHGYMVLVFPFRVHLSVLTQMLLSLFRSGLRGSAMKVRKLDDILR